jgi:hypothetical protein
LWHFKLRLMILRQDRGSPRVWPVRAWPIAGHGARSGCFDAVSECRNKGAIAMSDRADRPTAPRLAICDEPAARSLACLGVLAGLAALFLSGQEVPSSSVRSAAAASARRSCLRGAACGWLAPDAQALDRRSRAIRDDPAATVLSDADGPILAQNAASRRPHAARTAPGPAMWPMPSPRFCPTHPRSWRARPPPWDQRRAHETVPTPRGPVRLFVSRVTGGILWRLDEIREPTKRARGSACR